VTRIPFLALFVAAVAVLVCDSAQAQLPVAPAPREVRPDGTRDPAPKPETPAKAEDPAVVVDRIIKNSKDVEEKLSKTDTGTDTRTKQDKILSDIDALINRQEDPPPPKDDKEKDKNMMGMGGMQDMMPMPGMNDPPPMPMGNSGRKPRMGDPMGGDKKEPDMTAGMNPMKPEDKKGPGSPKDPKEPKNPSGTAGGNPNGKAPPGKPLLPFDEDVAKDVWGHLPDKLRQQMTQYYKEDVMPRYSELLKLYYSSLAEKGGTPVMPKK
jgi:hypothetical protein